MLGKHFSLTSLAVVLVLMVAGVAAAAESFVIRDGDRVVIYGDSISAGMDYQYWPRYFEAYLRTRYPAWTTQVWNRSRGGDTAHNLERFKRDCLSLKPDVILFNMGMNDGGSTPVIAPGLRRYAESLKTVAALAREVNPQVRLVLISPLLYEARASGAMPFYPYVLRSYAREERDIARRLGLRYLDLNRAYGEAMGLADGLYPNTLAFSADGVHPATMGGHLFIAGLVLRGLGAGGDLAVVSLDAANLKPAATGARVEKVELREGVLSFERTLDALPFPVVAGTRGLVYRDRAVASVIEVADDLNRDELRVTGLPAKAYALRIDDRPIAELSTEELAEGVNLSRFFHTPDQDQAVAVSEAVGRRQLLEGQVWRLSLNPEAEEASKVALAERVKQAQATLAQVSRPTPHRFTLTPLDHEVDRYQRYEQMLEVSSPPALTVSERGEVRQELNVTVRNLSGLERRVELLWSGPGATPQASVEQLAGGERREFSFALTLDTDQPAPRLLLKHQPVDLSFPSVVQEYVPVRLPRLEVPYVDAPLQADGYPGEGQQGAVVDLGACMDPLVLSRRAGPGDFSAAARLGWTAEALTVAMVVRDQDHVCRNTDPRWAWDDAVSVSVGAASYTLGLNPQGPAILPEDALARGVRFAVRREGLETRYELAIPWAIVGGAKPEAGAAYPCNLMAYDRDSDESHKDVYWGGRLGRPQPGTIRLAPTPNP